MVEKLDGIVLRTLKYSDNLLIADIYTRSRGRLSFLLPVSHSKRARVRSVLFQPLANITFTSSVKKGRLSHISSAQPSSMYSSIPYNAVKSSIALFLAELLTYSLRDEDGDEATYNFLLTSLALFDNLESGYADFHLVFMSQLLRCLGLFPNLEEKAPDSYLDLQQGCTVKEHPLHPHFLLPQDAAPFIAFLETGYSSMHRLSFNRELRGYILATLLDYYRLHIPDFPQLKSVDVLKELFS